MAQEDLPPEPGKGFSAEAPAPKQGEFVNILLPVLKAPDLIQGEAVLSEPAHGLNFLLAHQPADPLDGYIPSQGKLLSIQAEFVLRIQFAGDDFAQLLNLEGKLVDLLFE